MVSDKVKKLLALAKDKASTKFEKINSLEIAIKLSNNKVFKTQNFDIITYWDHDDNLILRYCEEEIDTTRITHKGITKDFRKFVIYEDDNTSWIEVEGIKNNYPMFILYNGIQADKVVVNSLYCDGIIEVLSFES